MMFGSDLLGVAVGLIVLYLLLSVLASAANEILESLLRYRSRYLAEALREMLSDPDGTTTVRALFEHPLVGGLFRGAYDPGRYRNLPSYIPAQTFAAALVDMVRGEAPAVEPPRAVPARLGLVDVPTSLRAAAQVVADPSISMPAAAQAPAPDAIALLRAALDTTDGLSEGPKRALLALIDSAGGDAQVAIRRIEAWYDSSMDRVTGWYKRHAQWMLFVLGLAIATLFNADTVALFKSLSNDPAERAMLLDAAREYAKVPPPEGGHPVSPASSDTGPASNAALPSPIEGDSGHAASAPQPVPPGAVPKPGDGASSSPPTRVSTDCSYPAGSAECRIADDIREVRQLRLPLGWNSDDPRAMPQSSALGWAWKVIGILVTAIAITLGAPFWFDMLNKVMVARAALKPATSRPSPPVPSER